MQSDSIHLSDKDVLLWIDRELTRQDSSEVDRHLAQCADCRARAAEIEHGFSTLNDLYRSELRQIPAEDSLARFQTRLHNARLLPSVITTAGAAAALVFILTVAFSANHSHNVVIAATPDSHLTPGDTSPVTLQAVCTGNLPKNDPAVPDPLKREVLREYGLKDMSNSSYEIDFLVTPQLGGAASLRNLWPQPAVKSVWNAQAKDQLEDRLHSLVCSGHLDLSTAQRELSTDWVAAYKKYFQTDRPRTLS